MQPLWRNRIIIPPLRLHMQKFLLYTDWKSHRALVNNSFYWFISEVFNHKFQSVRFLFLNISHLSNQHHSWDSREGFEGTPSPLWQTSCCPWNIIQSVMFYQNLFISFHVTHGCSPGNIIQFKTNVWWHDKESRTYIQTKM